MAKKYAGYVDLGLFFLPKKELPNCYNIANENPDVGMKAWVVGYPANRNGRYRKTDGKIDSTDIIGQVYEFRKRGLAGESGGPLFVSGHKIVGILSSTATNKNNTLFSGVTKIRKFLTDAIGDIPKCRVGNANETPSPNGQPKDALQGLQGIPGAKGAVGPRGAKGDRGSKGEDGTIDQSKVIMLRDIISKLKARIVALELQQIKPRNITIIIEDLVGKQLTTPVVIPPDKNTVRIPIERFKRDGQ